MAQGCCGQPSLGTPRPDRCTDGRLPRASADALEQSRILDVDLCGRTGSGRDGLIIPSDVIAWSQEVRQ